MKNKKIETNTDKVRLALIEYKDVKHLTSSIFTNIGFIVTLVITLFTTEFKDYFGISAEIIEVFIWLLLIVFLILTIKSIFQLTYYRIKKKSSINRFIANLEGVDYDQQLLEEKKLLQDEKYNQRPSSIGESILLTLRWLTQIIFYLMPIGLIIGLPFLFGYLNRIHELDILWLFYIFIVIGCLYSYVLMFQYWSEICNWFEDLFDGSFF
ncbi:MAG: hypothetical protein PHU32_04125 [Candidatus ainarchaeum sp.]|nr:hypothetical protein [Candidatus ainarchaeum sp.]